MQNIRSSTRFKAILKARVNRIERTLEMCIFIMFKAQIHKWEGRLFYANPLNRKDLPRLENHNLMSVVRSLFGYSLKPTCTYTQHTESYRKIKETEIFLQCLHVLCSALDIFSNRALVYQCSELAVICRVWKLPSQF